MTSQLKSNAVNVLLVGMDAKKAAIFQMAFKMHHGVKYTIVSENENPELAIVDVDSVDGMGIWHAFKEEYPNLPAILSSVTDPDFAVPYLHKPVKIDELFPKIRAAMKGEGLFDPEAQRKKQEQMAAIREERLARVRQKEAEKGVADEQDQFVVRKFQRKEQLPTASINVFSPNEGLLGSLRVACGQQKEVALIYDKKPLLIVFPDIQRILLAVPPEKLKEICQLDKANVEVKVIKSNPSWRDNAKVSFESCLWQFAVWSARGRLIATVSPNMLLRLKGWPNLTRLAHISDAMRLSAFMNQTTANLHILYKIMRVELHDLLNFIAATYLVGLLVNDPKEIQELSAAAGDDAAGKKIPGNGLQEDGVVVRQKYKSHSSGMLQRLMSRLAVKEE